jgi:lysine-N-methylase
MRLPIVTPSTQEKWSCHQCGICCRGSIVPLDDADLQCLAGQKWEEHPDFQGTPVTTKLSIASNRYRLSHREDGSCVFLLENGLCRIHAELGFDAKPKICRIFPLQLIPRDKDIALTIRRACPSAAADLGISVDDHLPWMKKMAEEGKLFLNAAPAPIFKHGETRDWKIARVFLNTVSELLRDERYPPVRRVVHAIRLAELLHRAKTATMSDAKVEELIAAIRTVVYEEAKPYFSERVAPNASARILFRSMASDYARLHPRYRARKGIGERIKLLRNAVSIFRGRGALPDLKPALPAGSFEDLEKALGRIDPSIDLPLTRMMETTSASYMYAIADRGQWSLIESVLGLAATFPIGLWLLRWSSIGREPTVKEMFDIVVALERGQGASQLTGKVQRSRLRTLASSGELARLVVWYAA